MVTQSKVVIVLAVVVGQLLAAVAPAQAHLPGNRRVLARARSHGYNVEILTAPRSPVTHLPSEIIVQIAGVTAPPFKGTIVVFLSPAERRLQSALAPRRFEAVRFADGLWEVDHTYVLGGEKLVRVVFEPEGGEPFEIEARVAVRESTWLSFGREFSFFVAGVVLLAIALFWGAHRLRRRSTAPAPGSLRGL